MTKRAAFITIGQTPRVDMVPEMSKLIGSGLNIVELGVLDGLQSDEILALRPTDHEQHLVTRLRNGAEATVGKTWMKKRLQSLLDELNADEFFVTVLLCTDDFGHLRSKGLFLDAQTIVDSAVEAIAENVRSLGVIVPLAKQIDEIRYQRRPDQRIMTVHASPYTPGRLEAAAGELEQADMIVMHCMGYTAAMRQTVANASGRPVLLARRLVAAAVNQLL
jgi:protein AroM